MLSTIFLFIFHSKRNNDRIIYESIIDKTKHIIHIIGPENIENEYTTICAGLYLLYNREIEKILIMNNNNISEFDDFSEYYNNNKNVTIY